MRLRGERKAHNEHAKLQNIFRINKSGRREFRRAPEFKFFYRSGSRYSGISRHDSTVKLGTGSSLNRACLALESCEREDRTQKLRKRLLRTDETLRNSWRRYIFTTVIMSCTKNRSRAMLVRGFCLFCGLGMAVNRGATGCFVLRGWGRDRSGFRWARLPGRTIL